MTSKNAKETIKKPQKTAEKIAKKIAALLGNYFYCVGTDLFSRAVARQVFSARRSLTTVFGMGTGGPSS